LAALLKNPAITPIEIANIKKGIAAQVSKSSTQTKAGRADTRFNGFTTARQALSHVAKTGNFFQRMLANRLIPFVRNVNFKVIEEDAELPAEIVEGGATEDWDMSRGMFMRIVATGERFVYVRGISGGPTQGVNNVTVLHEMLHAALNKKLDLALDAIQSGFDRNSDLARAYNALLKTANLTVDRVNEMRDAGTLPEFMEDLVAANIFGDLREFLAHGMSDPRFQKFLQETRGHIKESLFTRFVENIRQFFGIPADSMNALSDLVTITDKMLTSRKTPMMRMKEEVEQEEAKSTSQISSQAKKTAKATSAQVQKLEKGDAADMVREVSALTKLRNMSEFVDGVMSQWEAFDSFKLKQLLPMLQTSAVVQWAERLGLTAISDAHAAINDMAAAKNVRTNAMLPISEKLTSLRSKSIEQYKALANVMHAGHD
jgi:hypothetical protein